MLDAALLTPHGLDLLAPFAVGWYQRIVAPEHRLPELRGPGGLAFVVGSTAALWAPFGRALAADAVLAADPDPLERHVERVIGAAVAALGVRAEVRYAHEPPPRRVAIQRAAHVAGLAWLGPAHLAVHPVYGPWIALRAVIVVDADGPPGSAPDPERLACDGCDRGCRPALDAALAAGEPTCETLPDVWRRWLAVRDACQRGREHRYPDDMIRYGYTKNRAVLAGLAARALTTDRDRDRG